MAKAWRERLQERLREGIRHKVTPLGGMMVALLLASGILSFSTSQNVFFLLFSLLLASILISSFVNRLTLAGLEIRLELPQHPLAGQLLPCALHVENRKVGVASFALEIVVPGGSRYSVPCVPAGQKVMLALEMSWAQRGIPAPVKVELSTRFPFGFSVRRTRVLAVVARPVYPSIQEQAGFAAVLALFTQQAAGLAGVNDPEFSHLREYVPGDDRRRIAWGKSAQGPNWIVKVMQASSDELPRVWFDTASPGFERLVELSAFLVWTLCFAGTKFVFRYGAEELPVLDRNDAYTVLKLLATIAPHAVELPYDVENMFILSLRGGQLVLPGASETAAASENQRHRI